MIYKLILSGLMLSLISCSGKKSENPSIDIKSKGDFYYVSFFNKASEDTLFKVFIDFEEKKIELVQSDQVPIGIQVTLTSDQTVGDELIDIDFCKLKQINGKSYKASFSKENKFTVPGNDCETSFGNYLVEYIAKKDNRVRFSRLPTTSYYKNYIHYHEHWFNLEDLSFVSYTKDIQGLKIQSYN